MAAVVVVLDRLGMVVVEVVVVDKLDMVLVLVGVDMVEVLDKVEAKEVTHTVSFYKELLLEVVVDMVEHKLIEELVVGTAMELDTLLVGKPF
ncbi:unnamed protein product [Enterobius vermicularis]|uniref:Uncharacterized protein n=1 Tax=Enterobius vermicularis TaxID=51028 RepID=A0A0N4UTD5_ENTVE|nr:unnamed protein product [Enterobius vermicularis]